MAKQGEIVVGRRDVDPSLPSHVPGVHEGNWPLRARRRRGGRSGAAERAPSARRSTGIVPSRHGPIDPRMPLLTPP